jgi:hypothetical protein
MQSIDEAGMLFGLPLVRLELPTPASSLPALCAALYAVVALAKRAQVGWVVVVTTSDMVALLSGGKATNSVIYPNALVAVTTEDGLADLVPVLRQPGASS